jgi:acylphosphatase
MAELGKNVRVRVFVHGVVQDVGFRHATKTRAERFGIRGFIKNLSAGGVEVLFEGEVGAVDRMIEFCKVGPLGAKVKEVEIRWEEYKNDEFKDFQVLR